MHVICLSQVCLYLLKYIPFISEELGTSTFLFSDKTFLHVKQIDLQCMLKGNTKIRDQVLQVKWFRQKTFRFFCLKLSMSLCLVCANDGRILRLPGPNSVTPSQYKKRDLYVTFLSVL